MLQPPWRQRRCLGCRWVLRRRMTMKWITRERRKIDRIACPWPIARFIDKEPEFLHVAPDRVLATAERNLAVPYDIPGVKFTQAAFAAKAAKRRVGDRC